ncbi:MAG: aromatic amino acid transport family protein [Candidatus Roizmanbacteria bacterium]
MKHKNSRIAFWEAVATLVGGTIGAGILAIPYAISHTGLIVGIAVLFLVAFYTTLKKLMMAEIILRTKESHQIPGYIGAYLGKKWKIFSGILFIFAAYGALLAYIVGQGDVLSALLGVSPYSASMGFFVISSLLVYLGISTIKRFEVLLTTCMVLVVTSICLFSFHYISLEHFVFAKPSEWIIPYGVLLFALSGVAAVPLMRKELEGHERLFKNAILTGSVIILVIYLLFMTIALGVTGLDTTKIATIGLGHKIGPIMVILGNVLAFFTMGTCFLTLSLALQNMFTFDFGLSHFKAWMITIFVPLAIFLLGLRDFIVIISVVGGIFLSLQSILVVFTFWASMRKGERAPEFHLGTLPILGTSLIVISVIGIMVMLLNF